MSKTLKEDYALKSCRPNAWSDRDYMTKKKKIYYAHAMPTYGKSIEQREKKIIRKHLPEHNIVNPGSYQDNPLKRVSGMEYCFSLVRDCNALAFSRYYGQITSGVGQEINYALVLGLPVYEVRDGTLSKIVKKVKYLSRADTVALYREKIQS